MLKSQEFRGFSFPQCVFLPPSMGTLRSDQMASAVVQWILFNLVVGWMRCGTAAAAQPAVV